VQVSNSEVVLVVLCRVVADEDWNLGWLCAWKWVVHLRLEVQPILKDVAMLEQGGYSQLKAHERPVRSFVEMLEWIATGHLRIGSAASSVCLRNLHVCDSVPA
jgi:hypothetical protein